MVNFTVSEVLSVYVRFHLHKIYKSILNWNTTAVMAKYCFAFINKLIPNSC